MPIPSFTKYFCVSKIVLSDTKIIITVTVVFKASEKDLSSLLKLLPDKFINNKLSRIDRASGCKTVDQA